MSFQNPIIVNDDEAMELAPLVKTQTSDAARVGSSPVSMLTDQVNEASLWPRSKTHLTNDMNTEPHDHRPSGHGAPSAHRT